MATLFSNDYSISFEFRPDYLSVTVALPINEYNVARQYWTEFVRMLHRGRYVKAVIEISAQAPLPAADAKSLMSDFLKIIYPGIRIAIVNPWVTAEVCTSIEATAKKLGRTVSIVADRTAAENWLHADRTISAPPDPDLACPGCSEPKRYAVEDAPTEAPPLAPYGAPLFDRA